MRDANYLIKTKMNTEGNSQKHCKEKKKKYTNYKWILTGKNEKNETVQSEN